MRRTLHIALREIVATVLTRGFLIGVFLMPLLVGSVVVAIPLLTRDDAPAIAGQVAIFDPTGAVAPGLQAHLAADAVEARRKQQLRVVGEATREVFGDLPGDHAERAIERAVADRLGDAPALRLEELADTTALESAKAALLEPADDDAVLLVVAVDRDAVHPREGEPLGSYRLYLRQRLDDRVVREIERGLRRTIVAERLRARGLDPDEVQGLTRVEAATSTAVTEQGEQAAAGLLNVLIPGSFMILLFLSVLTSGQFLVTSTIEEKSSRVVEVLLSAVSPLQLMAGKILGQMCVGLLVLTLYTGLGLVSLASFAVAGLLPPGALLYLAIFYFIAYFMVASFMAAVGAAVNELREAQALLSPIMLMIMLPWLLWLPISRDPNSTFAVVTSFLPPFNSFVMLLRITSTAPPPTWQVWVSIGIGVAAVAATLWFAAKVFRIGLLMYGKPPSFLTLVRWARMS